MSNQNALESCTNIVNTRQIETSCRICFESGETLTKLPCQCTGSVGHIHDQCLIKWVNASKVKFFAQNGDPTMTCEVCKGKITYRVLERNDTLNATRVQAEAPVLCAYVLMLLGFYLGLGVGWFFTVRELQKEVKPELVVACVALGLLSLAFCVPIGFLVRFVMRCCTSQIYQASKIEIIRNQPQAGLKVKAPLAYISYRGDALTNLPSKNNS